MFSLPSFWNLITSTIVFFVAAGYLRRYLDEQGLPKGMTRGTLLVFTFAGRDIQEDFTWINFNAIVLA